MRLAGKKIILGVTGSIAAYKAVYLLRLLIKEGATVRVVTTPSVERFVGPLTFSSLSGHKVFDDLWEEGWSEHVSLGTWADLMVVAPCTANTLATFAQGYCDSALAAVYLAARCPLIIAPAMDADMYAHPAVRANIRLLNSYPQHKVLPTGIGYLASGLEGPGRLLEPEEILETIINHFHPFQPLAGKKVLITAGPTREALDPVRYISNHSTGKMGYALAENAEKLGAEVWLVSGPTALSTPSRVTHIPVVSASDMYQAVMERVENANMIIMSAAVSDYTPQTQAENKIKKQEDTFELKLSKTQDILKRVGEIRRTDQILVGFALETNDELYHAQEKLHKKKLDLIVLNSLKDPGAGFGYDTNKVTLIDRMGNISELPLQSKQSVAEAILAKILSL